MRICDNVKMDLNRALIRLGPTRVQSVYVKGEDTLRRSLGVGQTPTM